MSQEAHLSLAAVTGCFVTEQAKWQIPVSSGHKPESHRTQCLCGQTSDSITALWECLRKRLEGSRNQAWGWSTGKTGWFGFIQLALKSIFILLLGISSETWMYINNPGVDLNKDSAGEVESGVTHTCISHRFPGTLEHLASAPCLGKQCHRGSLRFPYLPSHYNLDLHQNPKLIGSDIIIFIDKRCSHTSKGWGDLLTCPNHRAMTSV